MEYFWLLGSLTVFLFWLRRRDWGKQSFALAPHRPHTIQVLDILLVAMVYCFTMLASSAVLVGRDDPSWQRLNCSWLILSGGYLAIALLIIHIARRRFTDRLRGLGIVLKGWPRQLGSAVLYSPLIFGLTFLALLLTLQICQYFGYEQIQKHDFLDMLQKSPPLSSLILLIISPALIAPVVEEMLFRGLLQNFFIRSLAARRRKTNITEPYGGFPDGSVNPAKCRWLGIIITSCIFALFHAHWQHWPALIVLSVGFGYCYERHGKLLIPIVIHSLFNILSLTMTLMNK